MYIYIYPRYLNNQYIPIIHWYLPLFIPPMDPLLPAMSPPGRRWPGISSAYVPRPALGGPGERCGQPEGPSCPWPHGEIPVAGWFIN